MNTMEWADVTYCKASAVSSGKPITTPRATISNGRHWWRAGRCSRNSHNRHRPSTAAMLARATVRNTGSNSSTATRVAGSEPLKISTPIKPLIQPLRLCAGVIIREVCSMQGVLVGGGVAFGAS